MNDNITNNVGARNQIIMKSVKEREKEILNNHTYAVWFGKDSYWHTYVYDPEKKNCRRSVKRKTYEKLLFAIDGAQKKVDKKLAVNTNDSSVKRNMITLEQLYDEWIKYKFIISNSSSYPYRISVDWKKYYAGTDIVKVPLKELDTITISIFVHSLIKSQKLTKKRYYNMAIILKQGLEFAVERGYIDKNPYDNVKIDVRLFMKEKKKPDETQVFLVDEEPKIIDAIMKDYRTGRCDAVALAIVIAFKTGLRLGELVALRFSDIKNGSLFIERMEIKEYEMIADSSIHFKGFAIVDHAKTDSSIRNVYLTMSIRDLLREIEESYIGNKNQQEDFIFCRNGKRVHSLAVERIIYAYCKKLNISQKGMHKIRKTYISTLIDGNVNINKVRQLVGHEDERTTYKNYCYNRYSKEQTDAILENVLA